MPEPSLECTLHPERDGAYRHFENAARHPFDAAAAQMTRRNAWWLAEAALLSYWPTQQALPIFQQAGLQAQRLDAGSTNCYVAWQDDCVMVAFRGTQPDQWGDVLDDLKFPPVAVDHGTGTWRFPRCLQPHPAVAGGQAAGAGARTLGVVQRPQPGCRAGDPGGRLVARYARRLHHGNVAGGRSAVRRRPSTRNSQGVRGATRTTTTSCPTCRRPCSAPSPSIM
ncbi:MAG: hypothetical protein MZW92_15505 [Comamonadaceae bacterium]|nr:hypothetical protein [Comamonadaceae bacterium]